MAAGTLNLALEQGATFRKTLTWKTGTPAAAVNLTGYTARMQLRSSPGAATAAISLTDVANAQGQLVLGGAAGTIEIYIKDSATMALTAGGVYDLELVSPTPTFDVTRLVQGKYTLSLNVTI